MPEAALQLLPSAELAPSRPQPYAPHVQARIDRLERGRTNTRWGDLSASTLTSVINRAATGDIADWIDLCEFAISTDAELTSLYDTRISRVAQADYIIKPNQFGNPRMAELAAEFVNEQMGRMEDQPLVFRELLHGIAVGVSVGECVWERDETTATNYVRKVEFRHGHRFRYDETWNLRLYDFGHRRGDGSAYGEALKPGSFIVHQVNLVAGYPGIGGVMRGCIYAWCLGRWVEKFWIADAEKNGSPLVYAVVPPNTPGNVRAAMLANLEAMANDHVGVIEQGVTIEAQAAAAAVKSYENYVAYLNRRDGQLAKAWLGASDIASPGEHGSQAAVGTRASVTTDPRMVADGNGLSASLQKHLFKYLIGFNCHKFGCATPEQAYTSVPIPQMKLKSADDQVGGDPSGHAAEMQAQAQGYQQEVGRNIGSQPGQPPAPGQRLQQPMMRLLPEDTRTMSYGDMLEIVKASSRGDIAPESAVALLCAGGADRETAITMVGVPQGPTFTASTADPKAVAPLAPGRTTKSPATGSRSRSPFAQTLRRASGASASSSPKASRKQP